MSFWSSLDWGSFVGGVVGAGGAFGAAWFVYSRENIRQRLSLQLKTIHNLKRTVEDGILEIQRTQNGPFEPMINILDAALIRAVDDFMPDAAEADKSIYSLILATTVAMARYLQEKVPENLWNDIEYRNSDSSVTVANDVRNEAVRKYLHLIRELEKIKDKHPWHQRVLRAKG